jgi:hypothetical protein
MSEEIKNGNMNNIDSLLVETFNEETPSFLAADPQELTHDEPEASLAQDASTSSSDATINNDAKEEVTDAPEVDEYGTEIPKPEKVYTKAEVEAMIRERVARMKQSDFQPQQPAQPESEYQAPEGDWEAQLESFIDHTLSKREQKIQQQRWQQQAQEAQAQFEIKFNDGVAKYADFEQVVYGKALTPQMVLATRGMNDPAAFIYAAAKTQGKELERIAQINDPMTQAVEMGQLAERMRKARSNVSQAPRPIEAPKGDVVEKVERTRNIDDQIRQEEQRLRKERARR